MQISSIIAGEVAESLDKKSSDVCFCKHKYYYGFDRRLSRFRA